MLFNVHGIEQENGEPAWYTEDEIKAMGLTKMVVGDELKKEDGKR